MRATSFPWLQRLTMGLLLGTTAACAFTPPQEVAPLARPNVLPVRNITSFSESLRCMDNLFLAFGKQNVVITSQGIPDATGEVSAGTKEMLISAIARMSERSNAFTFVDFDQSQLDINQLQGLVGFTQDFVVPNYYLRGAITQLDDNVVSETVGGSISLERVELGAQADQVVSVVSVDMNVGDLLTRQILPGKSANNSIAVRRRGIGGDAGGSIDKAGVAINVSFNRSEGMHQAVRTLVDLSTIETLGKLMQVPYWRCLQIEQTNPEMQAQARAWFNAMAPAERVRFAQSALAGLGIYRGTASGVLDQATQDAIGVYQSQNGLIADGRVNFDLYALLINGDLAVGRAPAPSGPAAPYTPTRPREEPVILTLTTQRGPSPSFDVGDALALRLQASKDAFAYCFYRDATGMVARIFPNRFQPDALLTGGTPMTVPGPGVGFEIVFEKPGAAEEVRCVAAPTEVGMLVPGPLKAEDLIPLPVRSVEEVVGAFRAAAKGQLAEARLPISVQ